MNSSSVCHEIPGCRGIYVDAFKGSYLRRTQTAENCFILSHYHGDHYGSLPRDGKYNGPAPIHCTPVTAALLREVHGVPDALIVEHVYGETWSVSFQGEKERKRKQKQAGESSPVVESNVIEVTFYDANHCPGAAIALFRLPNGVQHLHCGDMRFCEAMKEYPLLKEASFQRNIDCVMLDTTYADPKHTFVPQDCAVESIASQVESFLGSKRRDACQTLVLLSCYSIGKERVLWEASRRTSQKVYVTEKKYRMLKCIHTQEKSEHVSSQIIDECTLDETGSDIHVIPMGLAGEMWPFFRPNYKACADYANELTKKYTKVIAFIPTGWAGASNWNKKNAVTTRDYEDISIEIRLISYSEHSSFNELIDCVAFLNPRKVIPTVFKDSNDLRKIEARFKIDTKRAKQHFIRSMGVNESTKCASLVTAEVGSLDEPEHASDCEVIQVQEADDEALATLQSMGFQQAASKKALRSSKGKLDEAINMLLNPGHTSTPKHSTLNINGSSPKDQSQPASPTLKRFFEVKKKTP